MPKASSRQESCAATLELQALEWLSSDTACRRAHHFVKALYLCSTLQQKLTHVCVPKTSRHVKATSSILCNENIVEDQEFIKTTGSET